MPLIKTGSESDHRFKEGKKGAEDGAREATIEIRVTREWRKDERTRHVLDVERGLARGYNVLACTAVTELTVLAAPARVHCDLSLVHTSLARRTEGETHHARRL
jgi:hypothetical protein